MYPTKVQLEAKWWHRLLKVLFYLSLVLFFGGAFLSFSEKSPPFSASQVSIFTNMSDFARTSDKNIDDTVPDFLAQEGDLGCLEEGQQQVRIIYDFEFEDNSVCNADLKANLDKVAAALVRKSDEYTDLSNERMSELLEKMLDKETVQRYCLVPKKLNCESMNIIKYKMNILFYSIVGLQAAGATVVWWIFWWLVYFKVILYIAFGKKNSSTV